VSRNRWRRYHKAKFDDVKATYNEKDFVNVCFSMRFQYSRHELNHIFSIQSLEFRVENLPESEPSPVDQRKIKVWWKSWFEWDNRVQDHSLGLIIGSNHRHPGLIKSGRREIEISPCRRNHHQLISNVDRIDRRQPNFTRGLKNSSMVPRRFSRGAKMEYSFTDCFSLPSRNAKKKDFILESEISKK
jgi:hypothetical protein